jgi:hypothetical protein
MRPRPLACASTLPASQGVLALALACAPTGAPRDPAGDDRKDEVRAELEPLADADLARLDAAIAARTPLHWRLRTPDGPRCEPWQFEPDAADPHRGRLVHTAGASRFSFTYQIADGHLRLTEPTRERDTPVAPAAPNPETRVAAGTMTLALAFPCVFSGMSLTPADAVAARQLVLSSNERWFLDEQACAAAGPDHDPLPAAPGELHPIGCASALADPTTRERDVRDDQVDPRPPGPAAARLLAARRLFMLRARDGRTVCEAWHPSATSQDPPEGSLDRDARDRHGPHTLRYGYAVLGETVTLLGPNEFRRLHTRAGPADVTRARGCLLTRPLALRGDVLLVGTDPWFTTRRACEQARRAGAPAHPDLDCRPGHVPEASP